MTNDYLQQFLEITEQHLLTEFSDENTKRYKIQLQEFIGKILDESPEYKKNDKFEKLLKYTDEYLQKEMSLKNDLQYCRKLSEFICDILGMWKIKSVSLITANTLPTKEEMEKLLLSKWPAMWEEIEKKSSDGMISVRIGHISPYPEHVENPAIKLVTVADFSTNGMKGIETSKYDFLANLSITGYTDKQTAKQFFENYSNNSISFSNITPGMNFNIDIENLLEVFAPKELVKEAKESIEKAQKSLNKEGIRVIKGKFLNEEALFVTGKNGEKVCQAVLINNFIIMGDILGYTHLPPGKTPIHSCKCKGAKGQYTDHKKCSTLENENFIHKEKVELLLKEIFTRIKEKTKEYSKETRVEIIREKSKILNPKEELIIFNNNIVKTDNKTQITLSDSVNNKITIGNNTELKMETISDLKLKAGTITLFLKNMKSKFKIYTPVSIIGVRGTIFSVWTDETATTLTVIEGEIEFSDLNSKKVIVKSNQSCICSKEYGLQKPVSISVDLKAQYKEK